MTTTLLRGVAYITGAGSGIGQYTAYAFARHGVTKMALTDINPKNLEVTIAQLKKDAPAVEIEAIQMDTSKEADVDRSIAQTVKRFGRLDYAVNNAGIGGPAKPTPEVELHEFQKTIDVNLNVCSLSKNIHGAILICSIQGVWMCQRAQLREMLKQE